MTFDPTHDKLPDLPVTIGGDKSAAAWHPGSGPEVPYADEDVRQRQPKHRGKSEPTLADAWQQGRDAVERMWVYGTPVGENPYLREVSTR